MPFSVIVCFLAPFQSLRMSSPRVRLDLVAYSSGRRRLVSTPCLRGSVCLLRPTSTGCLAGANDRHVGSAGLCQHCGNFVSLDSIRRLWFLSVWKWWPSHQNIRASLVHKLAVEYIRWNVIGKYHFLGISDFLRAFSELESFAR